LLATRICHGPAAGGEGEWTDNQHVVGQNALAWRQDSFESGHDVELWEEWYN
jgi:hypothetical protein